MKTLYIIIIITITSLFFSSCSNDNKTIEEFEYYYIYSVKDYNHNSTEYLYKMEEYQEMGKIFKSYETISDKLIELLEAKDKEEGILDLFSEDIIITDSLKESIDSLMYYIKTSYNSELLSDSTINTYVNSTEFNSKQYSFSYLYKQALNLELCYNKIIRYYTFNIETPNHQRYTINFSAIPLKKEVNKGDSTLVYLQSFLPRYLHKPNITLIVDKDTFLMTTDTMNIKIPINKQPGKYKIECIATDRYTNYFNTEYTIK